ncbi:hypothetical protein FNW25_05675 [Flavobacterium franklandianum]|uniref:hypothetical protein n=1 Tax=Flavobacterium franklandianum TaxID=2594430 RepID=UPI00117B1653|nr:hypothetical protein [Flavobacterium franklandianum]TRX27749.1 hypothetical protein FNW25_05675 [Flavobacterium franklandianum]
MKNFNSIILVLLSVVLFSCSKEDDGSNFPTETIKIEDDLKINFADLTVVTINGEAKVDVVGNFSANTTNTVGKNLPLLFIKDNEIMFGYYSKTGLNNSISTTDLLLFYFTLHPEIALQGFTNSELLDKIKQNSNYEELTSILKAALNANTAPLKNASFVNLLNKTGQTIGVAKRQAKLRKLSKTQSFDFRYTYSRDGNIVWDKKFPLFATVGMEVVDAATGVSVSGPQLFDSSGLVLSPNSAVVWLWDNLNLARNPSIGTFKLPKDGKYEIRFTNGVDNFGTVALEEKVDFNNRFSIGITLLSIAIPIGIKDFLGATECKTALSEVIKNMKLTGITFVATDQISMAKFVTNLTENIFAVSVECVKPPQKAYLKLLYAAVNYLNKVEETSTLYLLLRDYLFSDIKGKETRNFYDGVSFGELQLTNTTWLQYLTPTGTEFSGLPKSEHTFTASVNETTYKYSINRSALQSTLTIDPASKEYAIDLPFEVTKTNSGDATLKGNTNILTSFEGKLASTFVMGTQETKFEIKPAFKNSGLSSEFVNLKQQIDSIAIYAASVEGKWKVESSHQGGAVYYIQHKILAQNGDVLIITNSPVGGVSETFSPPIYQERWSVVKNSSGFHLAINGTVYPYVLTYPVTFIDGGFPPYPNYVYSKE